MKNQVTFQWLDF